MKKHPDLYNRMITSLAPTVWGHDDVKKGILLQLFGGVHKTTPEGMRLRGKPLNTTFTTLRLRNMLIIVKIIFIHSIHSFNIFFEINTFPTKIPKKTMSNQLTSFFFFFSSNYIIIIYQFCKFYFFALRKATLMYVLLAILQRQNHNF